MAGRRPRRVIQTIASWKMPHYLVKDRLKGFRKAANQSNREVVRRIGAVTPFRDRLNVSKLLARRMGRSRETQTKEFGSTVFENRTDFIWTAGLPRIITREDIENIIMKNSNFRDEAVRGWRSRMNMPNIIQNRVGSKGLSEAFSFKERRDNCGAIWLK